MGLVISALVTFWVGFLIYKKYKPQPVLFLGGMILMYIAAIFGYGTILPAKAATGSTFFDAFEFIRATMSSNAGKLGMNIMAVGAFARYMDKIGASRSLVRLTIRPLLALKSPCIVLSGTWVVGMLIGLCINSASGLAMLLMVTMFPILIGLGVSRLSATAAVATTLCFDWSPSDTGTILSAETAGLNPVVYWTDYQVPIVLVAFVVVGTLHYFTQKYMDKRDGHVVQPMEVEKPAEDDPADSAPLWYAVLPVIPLALILSFSPLWITSIKMNIVMAMFIGLFIGACCEYMRWHDGKKVLGDIQTFFDGLGMQMANVITLIVAGQTFAQGLLSMGTINALISGSQGKFSGQHHLIQESHLQSSPLRTTKLLSRGAAPVLSRVHKGVSAMMFNWYSFRLSKNCQAKSFGGKKSVKGNRQGVLSRSITRRSGRIAK